ncbi:hypothetical protein Tco_0821546 [Tanacetum coccineum]|uniref:F-box associated domain-containing protein n=1 Tax=Tanacetum coccineum TaxID=301880 RepID=A0ABQ5AF60_9ASTR
MMKDKPVRQGHFYWKAENEQMVKIVVIMDQQGEIFLVDVMSRRVYWSHKTKTPSYSFFLSKDVVNYIDIDPFDDNYYLMMLYHHDGDLPPQLISKRNLQQRLEEVYQVYPAGIKVEVNKYTFELDYQSGSKATDQTRERFSIERHDYDISFSSPEPATIRWHLKFSVLKPTFPNSECPCKVYHARTPDEFIGLCTNLGITELPDGGLVEDLRWLNSYRLNKIILKSKIWKDDKMEGLYEDKKVFVMRMKKRSNTLGKIRKLRLFNDDETFKLIRFYGWQEVDDYYYLAIKEWKCDLEQFVLANNCDILRLDILT